MSNNVTAKLSYLRLAPRKVRAVADLIRGLALRDAEAQLLISPRRASRPLLKLLRSAEANAKNNRKLDTEKLYVKEIRVDQGSKFKRWTPRARGSVSLIEKKTSHVTLVLAVSDKIKPSPFTIERKKKVKKEEKPKSKKPEKEAKKEEPKKTEPKPARPEGFFKKVFRRKSI